MLYDITRTISPDVAVWPGDTPYSQKWVSRMEAGASVNVTALTLSPHTGTHADAPLHYNSHGAPLCDLPLEIYVGRATVVEVATRGAIQPEHLAAVDLSQVQRLLIKTPASLRPDDEWWDEFAYLAQESAERIGAAGVRLFGTDAPSVDHVDSKSLDAHHTFDRYNVYILENLNLRDVAPGQYELIALPLKIGVDGSPVRAVLRTMD